MLIVQWNQEYILNRPDSKFHSLRVYINKQHHKHKDFFLCTISQPGEFAGMETYCHETELLAIKSTTS